MEHCTKKPGEEKAIPAFGPDSIELAMRLRIPDTIEELVKEELDAALPKPNPRCAICRWSICSSTRRPSCWNWRCDRA